jgi:hypothetical protein
VNRDLCPPPGGTGLLARFFTAEKPVPSRRIATRHLARIFAGRMSLDLDANEVIGNFSRPTRYPLRTTGIQCEFFTGPCPCASAVLAVVPRSVGWESSRVVAGAVGFPEVLKRREINGDQTSDQEPGYAVT